MTQIEYDFLTETKNGQKVTIATTFVHPTHRRNEFIGIVHRGVTNCGKSFLYIQPENDGHPGASVTPNEILSIR